VLPDVLAPGLRIVFCGTAAGTESARRRCYYAHPQNKFWRTLFEIRLTDRLLDCSEFAALPQFGAGLTDIAKHTSGMDKDLTNEQLGRVACRAMEAKILACAPKILAFTSLNAGRRYLASLTEGRRNPSGDAGFGEQQETIGATRIWLLPSPSPAANWNWAANAKWWFALAMAAGAR
jgi:TDG/mug DNA glycosylase family protein